MNITSSIAVNELRTNLFNKIQTEKSGFTPYDKYLYYNAHKLGFKYNFNLGGNYVASDPIITRGTETLTNNSGFSIIYHTSGSNIKNKKIELFRDKYDVEDKPFYNHSGSFYLSFLMRGDDSINGNIKWDNYQIATEVFKELLPA